MPLQHFTPDNFLAGEDAVDMMNIIIDYINSLEARLTALEKKTETILIVKDKFDAEHPVERSSEETAPKCNCMVVNDKRVCPQHDVVITNDHKC